MAQSGNLTRRGLLEGAVATGAAALLRPAAAIGTAARPTVSSAYVGWVAGEAALRAPQRFALVGVEWAAPANPRIELRTRATGGSWSRWALASVRGHEPDRLKGSAGWFGEPIWTGPADYLELRSAGGVRGLRLHFVSPAPAALAHSAGLPLAGPVLPAGPGQPPIIARSAWARGQAPPAVAAHYGTIKLAFVHHSQTPNGYSPGDVPSILLSIFDYHRYVRQYWDIAYNFAIDASGRIWEARAGGIDMPVIGAHAGGYNAESTGAVVLGSFMDVAPTQAAIHALERLVAWKLSLHGLPAHGRVTVEVDPAAAFYTPFAPGAHVSLPRVAGHRDGDSTDCPGNAFYARLPSIRPRIAELAGTPARITLRRSAASVPAGTQLTLTGTLMLLGGQPLAAAPVEVQQLNRRSAKTIATATTGSDGSWSIALTPRRSLRLRAVHPAAPATVSDWVSITVTRRR